MLWPEDVVSLDAPLSQSPEEGVLAGLARALHTTLVVGVPRRSTTAFRNEVVAWGTGWHPCFSLREGAPGPLWWGPVPYRSFFAHLADLSAVPLKRRSRHRNRPPPHAGSPLGAMISFEVFYANRGRSSGAAGAQLLIVPTNTSSYGVAQFLFRRSPLPRPSRATRTRSLQAAPTGYSAAITRLRVLLDRSVLGALQIVTTTLDRRDGTTLYVRYGDLPVLLLAGAALIAGWTEAGRRSRLKASRSNR